MPQVVKLLLAETDLDDLWWYIAQDNPDAADRLSFLFALYQQILSPLSAKKNLRRKPAG
jgi:plasmid stabilization system protein ParE